MISTMNRLVLLVFLPCALGQVFGACRTLHAFDEVNEPSDDATLTRCRREARGAREAGASPPEAYDVYFECTQDGGLR